MRPTPRAFAFSSYLASLLFLLLIAFPAHSSNPGDRPLRVGTGSSQGAYHAFVKRLAEIAAGQRLTLANIPTQGSVKNLQLIRDGKLDAALVQNDIAYHQYYDQQTPNRSFHAALPLFPEYFQILVREDANILHLDALIGKRIALGAPGSGSYRNARDILKTAEISYQTVPVENMKQALDKLRTGEVDAICYTAATPPPSVRQAGSGYRLLSLPTTLTEKLSGQYPYFLPDQMNLDSGDSINTLSLMAYLVLANDLQPDSAVQLLSLIFDHWNTLANTDDYQLISLESLRTAIQRKPTPLHPAAERLLVDKGYLFDPWSIGYYLIGLTMMFVLVQFFAHALTTRYDRLGNLKPIKCLWRYRLTLLIQGLAVLIATLTTMALLYFIIMLFIQYQEARYATAHNLYNPFATMSIPDLMLWLWGWIGGYDSGLFPQSTLGKILVVFPPLIGLFSIGWLVFSLWKDMIARRVAEQMGAFVPPLHNHILICGWNEKARGIIFGLTTPYAPERKKVVVMAEMDDDAPLKRFGFPKGMVHYFRGDSSDTQALQAAHVSNASAALILAGEKKKHAKNIGSVLTTLAIKKLNPAIFTVAELRHEENTDKFQSCGIDALVYGETIIYRLAAQACFNPLGVSWFFDMITHDEHAELYAMPWRHIRQQSASSTAWRLFRQKRGLRGLFSGAALWISTLHCHRKHHGSQDVSPRQLLEKLARQGISLIAVHHPGNEGPARIEATFDGGRYTHFIDGAEDTPLKDEDILVYTAMEKEDIWRRWDATTAHTTNTPLPLPSQTANLQCRVLLIGAHASCEGVAGEIRHLDQMDYRILTDSPPDTLPADDPRLHALDDLTDFRALEPHLGQDHDVIIILADTDDMDQVCLDRDRGELDAKTLMLARYLRQRHSGHETFIIAEMLGRNTRELFISAGVDVVLPRSLIVERLMTKMAYGYGTVSNYIMAALALNDAIHLNNITLEETDHDWLGLRYEELLLRMPAGLHLLAIAPASPVLREKLKNPYQDFAQHYLACPEHGRRLGYTSQPGDILLVLDGRPKENP